MSPDIGFCISSTPLLAQTTMKLLHVLSFVIPFLLASPASSTTAVCCIAVTGGCTRQLKGPVPAEIAARLADPALEVVNLAGNPVTPDLCCCFAGSADSCATQCDVSNSVSSGLFVSLQLLSRSDCCQRDIMQHTCSSFAKSKDQRGHS